MCCSAKSNYNSREVWQWLINGASYDPCIVTSCNVYVVRSGYVTVWFVCLFVCFARLSVFILHSVIVHDYRAFTRDHTYMQYIAGPAPHGVRRQCNRYDMATGWTIRGYLLADGKNIATLLQRVQNGSVRQNVSY
jgi:hypothetical protein